MHSNNNELVKAGHDLAKALSADVPLTEIAKVIINLATQLDVTTAAVRAMQAERDQLAAECAALKEFARNAREEMESYHDDDGLFSYDADGEQMDALLRLCDAQGIIDDLIISKATPATDRFLAEQRAQGVEMFADRKNKELFSLHPDTHAIGSIAAAMSAEVKELREFAAQLRNEVKV
ncbi:TPA: hypothetical protein IB053_002406 [Escherichia coli]|nr:hypothetical protein [Escherichia coli]